MTKIGGYVSMEITDQYVECLSHKCDKRVKVKSIDNLLDINDNSPDGVSIQLVCEKCDCGFTTVLDFIVDWRMSLETSCDHSNYAEKRERFWWQVDRVYEVWDEDKYNDETEEYEYEDKPKGD